MPLDSRSEAALRASSFRTRHRGCAAAESRDALGLRLDEKQIQDHVDGVVYDHRDQSVRATLIPPPEPDTDPDSAEVEVPVGKRKRRNGLKPG